MKNIDMEGKQYFFSICPTWFGISNEILKDLELIAMVWFNILSARIDPVDSLGKWSGCKSPFQKPFMEIENSAKNVRYELYMTEFNDLVIKIAKKYSKVIKKFSH